MEAGHQGGAGVNLHKYVDHSLRSAFLLPAFLFFTENESPRLIAAEGVFAAVGGIYAVLHGRPDGFRHQFTL